MKQILIIRETGVKVYVQIKNQIIYDISIKELAPGAKLPSVRRMASHLGVAVATVRRAYAELEKDGFVRSEASKGIFVNNLQTDRRDRFDGLKANVVQIFSAAIAQAYAQGASASEVRAAATAAFSGWQSRPTVTFIGSDREFLRYYTPIIGKALADCDVEIKPVFLGDIQRNTCANLFIDAACAVTLVRSFGDVRKMLQNVNIPVIAMALSISDATKKHIMDITHDKRVMLLSEERNLIGIKNSVEQYLSTEAPLQYCPLEDADLHEVERSTDVVLHSLKARESLRSLTKVQKIEIQFLPDEVSLNWIRGQIAAPKQ